MSKLRTIFMGTPEFAVPCAKKLTEISDVIAVVTQPDQRSGRGQKFTATPVKKFAQEKGIPVYQPIKVKADDFVPILEALKPDLIVVVAFGQILSQRILDIPKYGCINVHASLLPAYRGAAPIQHAVIDGQKETEMLPFTKQYVPEINIADGYVIVSSEKMIFAPDEEEDNAES